MPLIVITGPPASLKTSHARKLQQFFTDKGYNVHVISENEVVPKAGFHKNDYFADSHKEKQVRSDMKSQALRLLSKNDVVILDAGNYIKGYRYELFCATKAVCNSYCTVFCSLNKESSWKFNTSRNGVEEEILDETNDKLDNSNVQYSRENFDALWMRFEEPNSCNRWENPLHVVFPEDDLDYKAIYSVLYESKPLPPNRSTQNAPLSISNYVHELDQMTQQIVAEVLAARKIGILGPVSVKGSAVKVELPPNINAIQLNRLRRQFLGYNKMHQADANSRDRLPQLFVQYLNSNANQP